MCPKRARLKLPKQPLVRLRGQLMPAPADGRRTALRRPGGRGKFFRRKKVCKFCTEKIDAIPYRDVRLLQGFVAERGKIVPRRLTGVCTRISAASPAPSAGPEHRPAAVCHAALTIGCRSAGLRSPLETGSALRKVILAEAILWMPNRTECGPPTAGEVV